MIDDSYKSVLSMFV